jgi:hypothetical protein
MSRGRPTSQLTMLRIARDQSCGCSSEEARNRRSIRECGQLRSRSSHMKSELSVGMIERPQRGDLAFDPA